LPPPLRSFAAGPVARALVRIPRRAITSRWPPSRAMITAGRLQRVRLPHAERRVLVTREWLDRRIETTIATE
jgi:hypothetical protein